MIEGNNCPHCGHPFRFLIRSTGDPFFIGFPQGEVICPKCNQKSPDHSLLPARDFRFSELLNIDRSYRQLKSPIAPEAVESFRENIDRVLSPAIIAPWVMGAFGNLAIAADRIQSDVRHEDKCNPGPEKLRELLEAYFNDRSQAVGLIWNANQYSGIHRDVQGMATFDDLLRWRTTLGVSLAIESILTSAIVGTWTAFETLSGDLWEQAVNTHPKILAGMNATKRRIENKMKGAWNSSTKKKNGSDRLIPLAKIAAVTEQNFDLTKKFGTLIRPSFDKLQKIREAYSQAFPDDGSGDVDNALADKNLNGISAVRNMIIHKAGIADAGYLKQSSGAPNAPQLAIGDSLNADGFEVRRIIEPVILCAVRLVKAVDLWIVTN